MEYPVVFSAYEPPDYKTTWYSLGNDLWTQDPIASGSNGFVPSGYHIDQEVGGLVKDSTDEELAPFLSQLLETKTVAKNNSDGKTLKAIDMILNYGSKVIKILADNNIIKNVNAPLTYDNIDKEKLAAAYQAGKLSIKTGSVYEPPPPDPKNPNSTFLGIDFSNGLNIALLVLGLIGLWKLISSSNSNAPAPQQAQQQNIKRTGQRRVVNV